MKLQHFKMPITDNVPETDGHKNSIEENKMKNSQY